MLDSVRNEVANLIFAGLSKFLWLVYFLIIFQTLEWLLIYPVNSIALLIVLLMEGSFPMSSSIKSIQWAAQGVQYNGRYFASKVVLITQVPMSDLLLTNY